MTVDVEELKRLNPIDAVVAEITGYQLQGRGKHLSPPHGTNEGGLVVNVDDQLYYWNLHSRGGDVIRFLENEKGMTFRQAVEWLAHRAGVPLHMDEATSKHLQAQRLKVDALTTMMAHLGKRLEASEAATAYCERRGWSVELAREARLGFWDGDRNGLAGAVTAAGLDVKSDVVQAVMGMPRDMLIYGHWEGARCGYLSGRSIEGKRHYNPERALLGDRQPLWNHQVRRGGTYVVVVEGQADAVTLAGWGLPAVALAGANANQSLVKQLQGFERVYVALDKDATGQKAVGELAAEFGPEALIVQWPEKDANDWAVKGGSAAAAADLLGAAPIFALWLCQRVADADSLHREEALNRAVAMVARMKPYAFERYSKALVQALPADIGKRELAAMVKALQKDGATGRIELTLPNGYLDGHLFEMTFEPKHPDGPKTGFAVRYPDGRIGVTRVLDTENYRIMPLSPYETVLARDTVKLAEHPAEYGTEMELLEEIRGFVHDYVDVPEHIEMMAAYYVMMTWMFDKFYVLPYLRARGDSDSGKSRFTETIGHLCFRSLITTGSSTPSPVFRLMSMFNGMTIIVDEADLPHSDTSADWTMMLNTGYKRSSSILRTKIDQGEATVEAFSAYGPKVLNMRGRFPDDATESRCLTWETSSGRGIRDSIERYMDYDRFQSRALEIRNKLLRWRLRTWADVDPDYNHERTKHLPGRLVEITVSIMSISQSEEFKDSVMGFIEKMNERAISIRQEGLTAKILLGILRAYCTPDSKALEGDERDWLSVGHITRQANRIINQENAEGSLADENEGDSRYGNNNRELSSHKIGRIIRDELNLETAETGSRTRSRGVAWDVKRINSLIVRYGYEDVFMELMGKRAELEAKLADGSAAEAQPRALNL